MEPVSNQNNPNSPYSLNKDKTRVVEAFSEADRAFLNNLKEYLHPTLFGLEKNRFFATLLGKLKQLYVGKKLYNTADNLYEQLRIPIDTKGMPAYEAIGLGELPDNMEINSNSKLFHIFSDYISSKKLYFITQIRDLHSSSLSLKKIQNLIMQVHNIPCDISKKDHDLDQIKNKTQQLNNIYNTIVNQHENKQTDSSVSSRRTELQKNIQPNTCKETPDTPFKPEAHRHQVTRTDARRFLKLHGKDVNVVTRLHYGSQTLPHKGKHGLITCATRSLLNLKNLIAGRNSIAETMDDSMIGPCDFFGVLPKINDNCYAIQLEDVSPENHPQKKVLPVIYEYNDGVREAANSALCSPTEGMVKKISYEWVNGHDNKKLKQELNQFEFATKPQTSLFLNPGILKVTDANSILLPDVDATKIDLSKYNAKLIKNGTPAYLHLPPIDRQNTAGRKQIKKEQPYQAVSYYFGGKYALTQTIKNDGVFLETHGFSQTMTPMHRSCGGFVTLARKCSENDTEKLELIGIKIPYGYTLVIGQGCIHGDTTLKGMYMMAMTANHVVMQSADTVFLKNKAGKNVMLQMEGDDTNHIDLPEYLRPLAYSKNGNKKGFLHRANQEADMLPSGRPFVLNPLY